MAETSPLANGATKLLPQSLFTDTLLSNKYKQPQCRRDRRARLLFQHRRVSLEPGATSRGTIGLIAISACIRISQHGLIINTRTSKPYTIYIYVYIHMPTAVGGNWFYSTDTSSFTLTTPSANSNIQHHFETNMSNRTNQVTMSGYCFIAVQFSADYFINT